MVVGLNIYDYTIAAHTNRLSYYENNNVINVFSNKLPK